MAVIVYEYQDTKDRRQRGLAKALIFSRTKERRKNAKKRRSRLEASPIIILR